jgi:hypothetical protein
MWWPVKEKGAIVPTDIQDHFSSLALARSHGGAPRIRIRSACHGTLGTGPPPRSAFSGLEDFSIDLTLAKEIAPVPDEPSFFGAFGSAISIIRHLGRGPESRPSDTAQP